MEYCKKELNFGWRCFASLVEWLVGLFSLSKSESCRLICEAAPFMVRQLTTSGGLLSIQVSFVQLTIHQPLLFNAAFTIFTNALCRFCLEPARVLRVYSSAIRFLMFLSQPVSLAKGSRVCSSSFSEGVLARVKVNVSRLKRPLPSTNVNWNDPR